MLMIDETISHGGLVVAVDVDAANSLCINGKNSKHQHFAS